MTKLLKFLLPTMFFFSIFSFSAENQSFYMTGVISFYSSLFAPPTSVNVRSVNKLKINFFFQKGKTHITLVPNVNIAFYVNENITDFQYFFSSIISNTQITYVKNLSLDINLNYRF